MKIKYLLFVIAVTFFQSLLIAQSSCFPQRPELSKEEKQWYVEQLDSNDSFYRSVIVDEIRWNKITEAKEKVENLIWNEPAEYRVSYLECLLALNSEKTQEYTLRYFDSTESEIALQGLTEEEYPYSLVDAAWILFQTGNDSKTEYLFKYINVRKPKVYGLNFTYLGALLKSGGKYAERAKEELLNCIFEYDSLSALDKTTALDRLEETLGKEVMPIVYKLFLTDNDKTIKNILLSDMYFNKYFTPEIEDVLIEGLSKDFEDFSKFGIVEYLMKKFPSVKNYKLAEQEYLEMTEDTVKGWLEGYLRWYKPEKPDSSVSITRMIDTLSNFVEESHSIGCVPSEKYNEYRENIASAKSAYQENNMDQLLSIVTSFNYQVENDYTNNIIERAAYKFLFYHSKYLIERLPDGVLSVPR